mgnify:CR=1 FL=1
MIKIDIHTHSVYSKHRIWGSAGFGTPKQMIKFAIKKGLNGLAITDHNSVKGSLIGMKYAKKLKNFVFITGSEIRSERGDILALGVNEDIPKGLSVQETIDKIHQLGGIAIAPHPYGGFPRRSSLRDAVRKYRFDALEVLNGGTRSWDNKKAYEVAKELNYPMVGGSDAHHWKDIGTIYNLMESDLSVDDILNTLKKGKVTVIGKPFGIYSKLRVGVKKVLKVSINYSLNS